ncbi:hypothetical protein [Sphingobacterium sp.]|uniref:hypothetical protein n=1 Tax=Sphingobacterium sp. TaxID=341027 RepID=UPI0031E27722
MAISTGLFSILAELVQLKRTILTPADLIQLQQPNSYANRIVPILGVRLDAISRTFVFQLHITAYTNNLWMI